MIICYTGSGNSRRIADMIKAELGDEIVRLPPGYMSDPSKVRLLVNDGRMIWIFPVHSWGMAKVIKNTIKEAVIIPKKPLKHYMICTCGDDAGLVDKDWRKLIRSRGWKDMGAFSVQMPNSYTFLKGFDVDPPELAEKKLNASVARVAHIIKSITAEEYTTEIVRGKYPWIKSRILYPLFMKYLTSTKPFHYTEDCNGCGKCARNCPINIIEMKDGHPRWNEKKCIICSRCYHCCPKHAIAYGNATDGKGQYICPGYTLK